MTDESVYTGLYVISEGPIEGPTTAELAKSIYCNDVAVMDSSGSMNFEGIALAYRSGLPSQTAITGIPAAVSPVSVGLEVTHAQPVEVTVSGVYDAVNVTISFPQGLYRVSDAGNQKGEDADYQIEVKSTGSSLWVPVQKVLLKYQKIVSAFEKSYRVDLPAGGSPWIVRVVRNSSDNNNPSIINEFQFARYETIVDGKFSYPNVALLALQIGAKQFNNQIPKVSGKFYGIKMWVPKNYNPVARTYATSGAGTSGGIWDGTFKLAYTNNPCWIYFDVVCNNRYGLGLEINPTNDVVAALADKWNLYVISQYADGSVDNGYGGTEPRFTFNAYLNTKAAAYDFLQMIVSSFRGMIYYASNQLYVSADIPDTIDAIFTQADVEDGNFTYNGTPLKTRSSVVYVKWQNPANQYKTEVEIVEDRDALTQFGFREKTIEGIGVTSRGLARRLAKWMLLTEKMQTQTVTFTTGFQGARLFPGNLIKIMNPYRAGLRNGGKLLAATTTTFTLDSPVTLAAGQTYSLTTVAPNGTLNTKTVTTGTGTTSTLTTSALTVAPQELSTWILTSASLDGEQYRVIQVKDKKGKYEVTAVQHYPNKYAEIEQGPAFPTPDTSVYSSTQLAAPTTISVNQWYDTQSGAEQVARITVSWPQVTDNRLDHYELELKTDTTPYSSVYSGGDISWDSSRLALTSATDYQLRVRAVSSLGTFSNWTYSSVFNVVGKNAVPTAPTSITAQGGLGKIVVTWTRPSVPDFSLVEVWVNTTNTTVGATQVAQTTGNTFTLDNLAAGITRYFFLRTVTFALTNNTSAYSTGVSSTSTSVADSGLADDIIESLDINTSEIAGEILRGTAWRAYNEALLYLENVPVGTVIVSNSDQQVSDNTALVSTIDLIGAKNMDGSAFILDASSVQLSDGSSVVTTIESLNSTVGDNSASITELQTITGAQSAAVTLTLDVNDHIVGYKIINDGSEGQFVIVADTFAIIDPADGTGPSFTPFLIEGGVVKMHDVEIDTLKVDSVITDSILVGAVSQSIPAYTNTPITTISNGTVMLSITITPSRAGGVKILFTGLFHFPSSRTNLTCELYRNGSPLTSAAAASFTTSFDGQDQVSQPLVFFDTSALSGVTYTYDIIKTAGTSIDFLSGSAFAEELKA